LETITDIDLKLVYDVRNACELISSPLVNINFNTLKQIVDI